MEKIFNEKDLEADTTKSMFKADGKIHEQERDVSKFWKNGEIRISILGIENQTAQDSDNALFLSKLCCKDSYVSAPVPVKFSALA